MAIIDPDGLFSGERLAACSDLAQLYWPRFFLAANSCGRLELSYKSIISRVFANFHKFPESSEIWTVFREYQANFLAVLYETEGGVWWCQFITSEKFLPKYKKTRDEMSPSPTREAMEKHRRGYLEWKKSNSFQNQYFQKTSEDFGREGVGIGVGIGIGVGTGEKPIATEKPSRKGKEFSPKYHRFVDILGDYWKMANPKTPDMAWGKKDIAQLEELLAVCPHLTEEQFRNLLANRARSAIPQGQRVYLWLANVTKFTEPLDRYDKPMESGGKPNAAVPIGKTEGNMAVLAEVIARRQRERAADQDGDLSASEMGQSAGAGVVHTGSPPVGPKSLPSGDGDPVGKPKGAGGNGSTIPW